MPCLQADYYHSGSACVQCADGSTRPRFIALAVCIVVVLAIMAACVYAPRPRPRRTRCTPALERALFSIPF